MEKYKNPSHNLLMIKVLHTVIWAFFVLIILYILYTAIIDRIDILTWIAIALIVVEGIILLINGWRCPLTIVGEKYTEQTDVGFDIFLPRWVSKNNKTIFTTIYSIGVILVIYRLLTMSLSLNMLID
ncbi:hypothetical protein [Desulfosporosinus sp. I2]|uniref:hypothetical protein n=1 Tax=Desulfosporosinus sp. I2 TaxID=1617025 RepID=UPI000AD99AC2|nr:hypothetical protein [Desulfosporosinus sp. I2]